MFLLAVFYGSSLSNAIQRSDKMSLTKNIASREQNIDTTIVATKFDNGSGNDNDRSEEIIDIWGL